MAQQFSTETKDEALKIAKATQKPGQTKEQTKLIAQGIEKGIAEYKKRQKSKARDRDKARKQELKAKQRQQHDTDTEAPSPEARQVNILPWLLLALSWVGFICAYLLNH
ncbi:DUF2956 domain-containing protein [Shewanella marisflavi]|uniref:DUF2956 domain-containing protein n=1 Tax=Shewanella marisflavi TaxID=260364 RepID=A0AAC9TYT1_9GAMM|nr:DUF2956 domain-containing protein [Shewanella marisflavi]ASJ95802.1 hypothetical protein CFF01_03895 [Shewanella marisflavi]MCL1041786.1 DUF2956 domain-containing protein [Shewanella marisflavi]